MIIGYLWGRKVASIQPKSLKNDYSPLSRWGLIPILKNTDEIIEFIEKKNFTENQFDLIDLSKFRLSEFGIYSSIKNLEHLCKLYLI